ncbi:hypothetical protein HK096_008066, partial [Nowakowskiella sp. JEL0078]
KYNNPENLKKTEITSLNVNNLSLPIVSDNVVRIDVDPINQENNLPNSYETPINTSSNEIKIETENYLINLPNISHIPDEKELEINSLPSGIQVEEINSSKSSQTESTKNSSFSTSVQSMYRSTSSIAERVGLSAVSWAGSSQTSGNIVRNEPGKMLFPVLASLPRNLQIQKKRSFVRSKITPIQESILFTSPGTQSFSNTFSGTNIQKNNEKIEIDNNTILVEHVSTEKLFREEIGDDLILKDLKS